MGDAGGRSRSGECCPAGAEAVVEREPEGGGLGLAGVEDEAAGHVLWDGGRPRVPPVGGERVSEGMATVRLHPEPSSNAAHNAPIFPAPTPYAARLCSGVLVTSPTPFITSLLFCLLTSVGCAEVRSQDNAGRHPGRSDAPVRYYDFDVTAEYRPPSWELDTFRYSYLGYSEPGSDDPGRRYLERVRLGYAGGELVGIDTVREALSDPQADSLFSLATRLFDLERTDNLTLYPIPPPPPTYNGYEVDLRLDLGFRGRSYATRFILLDREGSPEIQMDDFLRSIIPIDGER